MDFDAIVVGSGISGGWAAKELTERGLKVLMLERGAVIEHRQYRTEFLAPWELPYRGYGDPKSTRAAGDEWTAELFADDNVDDLYETTPESNFRWIRGYHTGGRSLMWARQSYRMSEFHFDSNRKDGHGIDWPIRYADLAPWYDHVEEFIGVSGAADGVPTLPDGKYQPSMGLNAGEQHLADLVAAHYTDRKVIPTRHANLTQAIGDRMPCQYRNQCARGCSFGAYFSTQSSTLPAARATGRLTLMNDAMAESIEYDRKTKRATGVKIIDTKTGARSIKTARIVFLCAGSYNSVGVLLRSAQDAIPGGLGNSGGVLGKWLMDHPWGVGATSTMPGLENAMYLGRKPNHACIPRFVNVKKQETDFLRGYSLNIFIQRQAWNRGGDIAGVGVGLKEALRRPGPWYASVMVNGEMLPSINNTVTLDPHKRDNFGLPVLRLDLRYGDNDLKSNAHGHKEILSILSLLGGQVTQSKTELDRPGTSIHEMGGACMGNDPSASVIGKFNQVHDAPNVFVTDGAAMCSTGDRNPSLTYMALTARASAHAVELMKENVI